MTRRKSKVAVSRNHEDAMIESLRSDPEFAAAYLDSVLEDGDQEEFLLALRRLSEASGGIQCVAARAGLGATVTIMSMAPAEPSAEALRTVST